MNNNTSYKSLLFSLSLVVEVVIIFAHNLFTFKLKYQKKNDNLHVRASLYSLLLCKICRLDTKCRVLVFLKRIKLNYTSLISGIVFKLEFNLHQATR